MCPLVVFLVEVDLQLNEVRRLSMLVLLNVVNMSIYSSYWLNIDELARVRDEVFAVRAYQLDALLSAVHCAHLLRFFIENCEYSTQLFNVSNQTKKVRIELLVVNALPATSLCKSASLKGME